MALDRDKAKDKVKQEVDELDLDELDISLDGDDEDDVGDLNIPKLPPKKKKEFSKGLGKTTKIVIGASCALLVVAVVIIVVANSNKSKADLETQLEDVKQQQEQQQLEKASSNTEDSKSSENIKAGAPNLQVDTKAKNNTPVTDQSKITSDLNGDTVEENYTFKDIKTVRDFINFKKYRAITADGMEFYWLQVTYKEKPYKVQVPYKIFKELDDSGITIADIEVTTVDKGQGQSGEIVTYMDVVKDSKKIINSASK